jgi:hypothetical protein
MQPQRRQSDHGKQSAKRKERTSQKGKRKQAETTYQQEIGAQERGASRACGTAPAVEVGEVREKRRDEVHAVVMSVTRDRTTYDRKSRLGNDLAGRIRDEYGSRARVEVDRNPE